jgi:uncharacterized protein (TIGR02466 family)|tara:strand:- start:645 stop:1235 length:591 start_codon:yes stop_codon:yes gene_type:complete
MDIVPLFANYLAFDQLNLSNRRDLSNFCRKQVEIDKLKINDNVSQSLFIDPKEPIIEELGKEINKRFDWLHKERNFNDKWEQRIQKFWINVNNNINISTPHRHPESFFSAVYYPDVGDSPGSITFLNPNNQLSYVIRPEMVDKYDEFNAASQAIIPQTDMLIIFPSWLWHFVNHEIDPTGERISIAFDSMIVNKDD